MNKRKPKKSQVILDEFSSPAFNSVQSDVVDASFLSVSVSLLHNFSSAFEKCHLTNIYLRS